MSSSMVVTPPSLAVRAHTPTAWFLATVGNSSAVNRYTVAKAAAAAGISIRVFTITEKDRWVGWHRFLKPPIPYDLSICTQFHIYLIL